MNMNTDKLVAGGVAIAMAAVMVGAWVAGVSVSNDQPVNAAPQVTQTVVNVDANQAPSLVNVNEVRAEIQESARKYGISEDTQISVGRVIAVR